MIDLPDLEVTDMGKIKDIWVNEIPHLPGVYFFSDADKEIIYVGKTKDLQRRYIEHTNKTKVGAEAVYYAYTHIPDAADVDMYETYYINKLKPKLNIGKRFYKGNESKETELYDIVAARLGISARALKQTYLGGH